MTPAVAYYRVSGKSQIDGDGFHRQADAVKKFSLSFGFEIIHEFQEQAVPGKLDQDSRPAFQEMVSSLLGNGCRTIIVESMDRFARELRTQEQLIVYLASKGLSLISANTGENITEAMMGDPMRRALVQMQGVFAELEKNMIISKLKKARSRKKETGGHSEGRYAYGQHPAFIEEETTLNIMKNWRSSDWSFQEITERLNALNYKTRYGKPWSIGTVAKILNRQEHK